AMPIPMFSEAWQNKRMWERPGNKNDPGRRNDRGLAEHSSVLIRVFLVGLLLSRARLRFPGQGPK
ncbi:MAG: hypothetical protein L6437_07205, partial [Kiritimatiellae bacterium]|nr:hypothetical protein [Kiritimatiellia bacterium]